MRMVVNHMGVTRLWGKGIIGLSRRAGGEASASLLFAGDPIHDASLYAITSMGF